MAKPVVHFEIGCKDTAKAGGFYTSLFGWETAQMGPALMVQTAGKFKSRVKIVKDEQEVDGKSIMGLMTLAACAGTSIKIVADGADEKEALGAMGRLIESGFGEE